MEFTFHGSSDTCSSHFTVATAHNTSARVREDEKEPKRVTTRGRPGPAGSSFFGTSFLQQRSTFSSASSSLKIMTTIKIEKESTVPQAGIMGPKKIMLPDFLLIYFCKVQIF